MRDLDEFSIKEWLKLIPLRDALKQFRNDLLLRHYLTRQAADQERFVAQCRTLRGKNIAIVIAFEQPLALRWLLIMSERFLPDWTVLVFDNSRHADARRELQSLCKAQGTGYLALPPYHTRHVNRSHGMAMSWVYQNVVCRIEPGYFGFIDHDMIPVRPVELEPRFGGQDCYGLINDSATGWNLWAGYSFFRFEKMSGLRLNFLYDFSRGLDTGGRNWRRLYSRMDRARMAFADTKNVVITIPSNGEQASVQVVDDCWVHIGGISYNNNFQPKQQFFAHLITALEQDATWEQLTRVGSEREAAT